MQVILEDVLKPTLGEDEFSDRFAALHKQLWCSDEPDYDEVTSHVFTPPKGFYQTDHSFLHDGQQWHMYYVTGNMENVEEWSRRYSSGDYAGANEVCVEPGNGHAVGKTLSDLKFVENVFFESQGTFDLASRGCCSLFKYDGRYGMLYDVRGDRGGVMSLAWSDDLSSWSLDDRNPALCHPDWANPHSEFKDPHVMQHNGLYLIYAIVWDKQGYPCIGLITTENWIDFQDHGPVFRSFPFMRGTFGLESPFVVLRDGMWHLFYSQGSGLWHAVSPSPTEFVGGDVGKSHSVAHGAYLVGSFHASELIQDGDDWWLTTDRKEQARRLNRKAGRMCGRGSYEDDRILDEGLYLSHVQWQDDLPIFEKP